MVAATTAYRTQNAKMGCYQSGPTYRKEPRNSAISRCFWAFNYIYACIKDCVLIEPVYSTGEKIDDDYAVFASAGGVRSFFRGGGSLSENTKCISIGEVTAAELKKYGINGPLLPTESTAEGIIQKILSDK